MSEPKIVETEIAWAAGFFDGEGCIRWRKPRERTPAQLMIQVVQVHIEPLERFKSAVGVGNITGPYGPYGNRQPYYVFHTSGPNSIIAFNLIKPFLSSIKTLQGDGAIEKYWAWRAARVAA